MEQQWINHSEINMMKFQFKNSDFNPIETWQCALHQYIFKAVWMQAKHEFLVAQWRTFSFIQIVMGIIKCLYTIKRVVWKVRGMAAVRRCYAEGGGDLRQEVAVGVTQ